MYDTWWYTTATSILKLQKFGNLEYAYFLRYLKYTVMLHTKRACDLLSKRNLYLEILFSTFSLIDF